MTKKEKSHQGGFTYIETLLAVIIIVVIASVGFFLVRHHQHNLAKARSNSPQLSNSKKFCDDIASLCFYYPKNWKTAKHGSQAVGLIEGMANPSATVGIAYFDTTPTVKFSSFQTTNPTIASPSNPKLGVDFVQPTTFRVISITTATDHDFKVYGLVARNL